VRSSPFYPLPWGCPNLPARLFFALFVTRAGSVPPSVRAAAYGQRRTILGHCRRLPLIRYYHDQQKGISKMVGKKRGPKPGTPQAKHGGEAVKAKYGSAYYAEIGKKGGAAVKEAHGFEHYSEIGKKGGAVTGERHGSEHYSRIGTKGGNVGKQRPDVP